MSAYVALCCLFLSRQLCFIMHVIRTTTLMLLLLLGATWSLSITMTLYRGVLVSNATVATSTRLEDLPLPDGPFQSLRCASACSRSVWCDLFCLDSSNALCLLSNMIVMANYAEKHADDALPCYTRRRKDLATGASIQAVPSPELPVKENLVDGIYGLRTYVQCFYTDIIDNPWFLLDFGSSVTFRTVRLFAQPSGVEAMLPRISNIQVRFGMSAVATPGNFGSYQLFAKFAGPATEFGQIVTLEAAAPVAARYLSVQKMDVQERFQFCHIEVF